MVNVDKEYSKEVKSFPVSKENVVLHGWEMIKVELPPLKVWKADVSSVSLPSSGQIKRVRILLMRFFFWSPKDFNSGKLGK